MNELLNMMHSLNIDEEIKDLPVVKFEYDYNWHEINDKFFLTAIIEISKRRGLSVINISKKLFKKEYTELPYINVKLLYIIPRKLAEYLSVRIKDTMNTFKDNNIITMKPGSHNIYGYNWEQLEEGDIYITKEERLNNECKLFDKVLYKYLNTFFDETKTNELVNLITTYTKFQNIKTRNNSRLIQEVEDKINFIIQ